MDAIQRQCAECARPFEVSVDEQAFLAQVAAREGGDWHMPKRCRPCRAGRRQAKYAPPTEANAPDEWLTCVVCGQPFIFGGRDRLYFAARGWTTPRRCRRCRPCRHERRATPGAGVCPGRGA